MNHPLVRLMSWLGSASLAALVCFSALPAGAEEAPGAPEPFSDVRLSVYGDLFAGYTMHVSDVDDAHDAFDVERARLGVEAGFGLGYGALELESVRSAGPESAFGVDGNSLLVRIRRAEAGLDGAIGATRLYARAGMVRSPWVAQMDDRSDLRALGAITSERVGLLEPGDLGAQAGATFFGERLEATLELSNGEGRADVERNDGKNAAIYLRGRVLDLDVHRGPLTLDLHAFARDGSVGVGSARAHRVGGAITFVGPCPRAGVEFVRAWGFGNRGDHDAFALSTWAQSRLATRWIGVLTRVDWFDTVAEEELSDQLTATVGLFSDVAEGVGPQGEGRVRLIAAVDVDRFSGGAPGVVGESGAQDATRFRLLVDMRGAFSREGGE